MSQIQLYLSHLQAPAPIGPVLLATDGVKLVGLDFGGPEERLLRLLRVRFGPDLDLREAADPLGFASAVRAYFDGRLDALDGIPVDGGGTPFQRQVWAALRTIPAGETRTYGQIAVGLGQPGASRAVGMANGLNPINLVVPCHRVIGSTGALAGYGGGLDRKRWLLAHEQAARQPALPFAAALTG